MNIPLPDSGVPVQPGDDHFKYKGVYHPITWINDMPYRPRVETLVIMGGNMVYVRLKDGDKLGSSGNSELYELPGGSIDADSSPIEQAENEINEEALISVKNIYDTGIQYYADYPSGFLMNGGDTPLEYSGHISSVFVAEYKGIHDRNSVEKKDLDPKISENGKFYLITKVVPYLRQEHIDALLNSPYVKDSVKGAIRILNRKTNPSKKEHQLLSTNHVVGDLFFVSKDSKMETVVGSKYKNSTLHIDTGETPIIRIFNSIEEALTGYDSVFGRLKNGDTIYAYAIDDKIESLHTPSNQESPSSKITGELWIRTKRPVKVKRLGLVRVSSDGTEDKYYYGKNSTLVGSILRLKYDWVTRDVCSTGCMESAIVLPSGSKLYHGSTYLIEKFEPMALDLGNAQQEPGWSTFTFADYTFALRFGLMRAIQKVKDYYGEKCKDVICSWSMDDKKPFISADHFKLIKSLIEGFKYYVYTIDPTDLDVGIGNNEKFPEYTFRESGVIPEKTDVIKIDDLLLNQNLLVLPVDNAKEYYEKQERYANGNKNRGWYSVMMTKDYNNGLASAQLQKAIKDGKLRPGDDIELYMRENDIAFDDDSISMKEYSSVTESLIISKGVYDVNFKDFESGKSNIVLITGLSGSGKSTLGTKIANKYNAELIELDLFEQCYMFTTSEQLREGGEVFYQYLSHRKELWDRLKKKEIHGTDLSDEIDKFLKYAISWCKADKNNKYVLEGVQIYSFLNKEKINGIPILFVGTSVLKSLIRRLSRAKKHSTEDFKNQLKELPQCIAWYIDENRAYEKFKKSVLENTIPEGVQEACKNITEARKFVNEVGKLAKKYDANYFIVTDGASGTSNRGNPAVKHARECQIEWEKERGFDPYEDWSSQVLESEDYSIVDKRFKPKGTRRLSDFKKLKVDDSVVKRYKNKIPDITNLPEGSVAYVFLDGDEYVGKCCVCPGRFGGDGWISQEYNIIFNFDVAKKYRGYSLGKQILEFAVKSLRGNALYVYSDNEIAISMYKKHGFKIHRKSKPDVKSGYDDRYFMVMSGENEYEPITESAEYSSVNRYPVFIILMHTGTTLSSIIKNVTRDDFSHVAISFNSKLSPLYSFGTKDYYTRDHGFVQHDTKDDFYRHYKSTYSVFVMYVSKEQRDKMLNRLQYFIDNADSFKFDIAALIACALKIPTEFRKKFFCSRFCMEIIGQGIELEKVPSLWSPQQMSELNNISLVNKGDDFYKYDYRITEKNLKKIKSGKLDDIVLEAETPRSELPDSEFGLPKERKYPLDSVSHVNSAIKFFNYVSKDDEEELANNIIKKINEYDMTGKLSVTTKNRIYPYLTSAGLMESLSETDDVILNDYIMNLPTNLRRRTMAKLSEYRKENRLYENKMYVEGRLVSIVMVYQDLVDVTTAHAIIMCIDGTNQSTIKDLTDDIVLGLITIHPGIETLHLLDVVSNNYTTVSIPKVKENISSVAESWIPLMEASDDDESATDYTAEADTDDATDYTEEADTSDSEDSDNSQEETASDYTEDANTDESEEDSSDNDSENETSDGEEDMTATDYTDEAGSSDDDGSGDSSGASSTNEIPRNGNLIDNNVLKNYSVLTNFEKLYNLTKEVSDSMDSVVMPTKIQNTVLAQALKNLNSIKEFIVSYVKFQFSSDNYAQNLYYYNIVLQALNLNLEILKRNKDLGETKKDLKKSRR